MPETLYLIDGHALAYRMYFALSSVGGDRFTTKDGEPTAGVYGFINALVRLLEKEKPEYLAVAFDVGKTFRDDIFPDYKGTREKMPDDLRGQIKRIKEIIDAFGFPRLEVPGYEADDVLGSAAKYAVQEGLGVKIITGDRDLLQLVEDRVIVNLPSRRTSETIDYTAEKVIDYLGIRTDQVVDYKALAGDSSDNIPGIRGVGDKTAKKLLAEYNHLDNIYQHIEEIAPRYRTKLEAGKESAYMSYDLARIRTDVKFLLDLEAARTNQINLPEVLEIFQTLEFRALTQRVKRLFGSSAAEKNIPKEEQQLSLFAENTSKTRIGVSSQTQHEVRIVNSVETLNQMCADLDKAKLISFDTETTGKDPMRADLVGISFAVRADVGYYIPVGHNNEENQLSVEDVIEAIRPAMTNPAIGKIGHNLNYDVLMLAQSDLSVEPLVFDTMIAQWLLEPAGRHLGLKTMADEILGIQMIHIEELIGSGKKQISMAEVPVSVVAPYATADATIPLLLMKSQEPKLEAVNARSLFDELEIPLIHVLVGMEQAGIKLDTEFLSKMEVKLSQRNAELVDNIFRSVGFEFNINSTQQLSDVLFNHLALKPPPYTKKTASGKYSTAASVLESMAGSHPVVDWVLEYRELSKLSSTYVKSLPNEVNERTGRVHSSFSQTVAVTGRLSSSNPNLQNIPTRTELGRQVRKAFIAEPGNVLLAVDYSQIELRIVAHMSKDEAMIAAFLAGQDIHAATAAAIYKVPLEMVTKDMRRHAKAINFGLIYGMSPFGLSQSTGLTMGEAETFVNAYFKQFTGVKAYLDQIRQEAAQKGYVETMLGRRRYFPSLKGDLNATQRRRAERGAINAPIQGTAADIMKIAMIRLMPALTQENLHAKLILQIHDELMLECPEEEVEKTLEKLQDVMENAIKLSIPLSTEGKIGKNWAEMETVAS
ncbi:MAG: DNA polymerase I [Anaerolineaceae bacterium]|nr:DNA polymerase I [Anaerolineaceae bacterium]